MKIGFGMAARLGPRTEPGTRRTLLLAAGTYLVIPSTGYIVQVYFVAYATTVLHLPRTNLLLFVVAAALAFLMACAAAAAPPTPPDPYHHARHDGPIALTAAEIRRLFNALIAAPLRALASSPLRTMTNAQRWSDWRRLHQGRARRSHYQRRLAIEFGP